MLDDKDLETLQESCSAVANQNWDGHVAVAQDPDGVLQLTLYSEDDEVEAHWTARPCGDFEGHSLYLFKEAGGQPERGYRGVVMTLVPVAICGMLGL